MKIILSIFCFFLFTTSVYAMDIHGYIEGGYIVSSENYYCNLNQNTEVQFTSRIHLDIPMTKAFAFHTDMITYMDKPGNDKASFHPSGIDFRSSLSYTHKAHQIIFEHSCFHGIDVSAEVAKYNKISYRYSF